MPQLWGGGLFALVATVRGASVGLGSLGSLFGGSSLSRAHDGLLLDAWLLYARQRLGGFSDERHASRHDQIGCVKHRVEVDEGRDVELDTRRQIVRLCADEDRVTQVEHDATLLGNGVGRADEDQRYIRGALDAQVDDKKIDMEREAVDGVLLDPLEQHGLDLAITLDREIDHGVAAYAAAQQFELVHVE